MGETWQNFENKIL